MDTLPNATTDTQPVFTTNATQPLFSTNSMEMEPGEYDAHLGELVYSSRECEVYRVPGATTCAIIFTALGVLPKRHSFNFFNCTMGIPVNKIYIKQLSPQFYNNQID
jgi:hypothetical protein